ncbi:hypothetical protein G7Y89_g7176 [Cudoniella acicularis]|uniref:FAD synthase n=1 Tax=Cudoniella acicularis TaxID=354080 RepID=A0A8H4RJ07_9HELO|nr:hypothetical protein G7Y89_g7176 [Cudoniella acicularis]
MTQDAPSDAPRTLPDICQLLRRKIIAFLEEQTDDEELRNVQSQVRVSMRVIEEALSRYGPEQLAIAYNGGKDCIVLLVLILACLPTWTSSSTSESKTASAINTTDPPPISSEPSTASSVLPSLQAVYIIAPNPFPEVEEFVETSTKEYHLDLARYALPMRPALEAYLGDKPAVKAIFVGTRRTDPHGEFLTHFDPTDKDWPQFMRIHPVIDWHYTDIWTGPFVFGRTAKHSWPYKNETSRPPWRNPSTRTCPNIFIRLDSDDFLQRGTDTPKHIELPSFGSDVEEAYGNDWLYEGDSHSDYDSDTGSNNSENQLLLVEDEANLANGNEFPGFKQSANQESIPAALKTSTDQFFGDSSSLVFTAEMSRDAEAAFFSKAIEATPPFISSRAKYLIGRDHRPVTLFMDLEQVDVEDSTALEDEWGVYGIAGASRPSRTRSSTLTTKEA